MRATILGLATTAALALAGCGDGVDRWQGEETCQPACVINDASGERYAACVDENNDVSTCREMGKSNVSCPTGGQPTCDTEDGKPRCPDEDRPKPDCVR